MTLNWPRHTDYSFQRYGGRDDDDNDGGGRGWGRVAHNPQLTEAYRLLLSKVQEGEGRGGEGMMTMMMEGKRRG